MVSRILLKELGLGSLERSVLRSTTPSSSVSDKLLAEKKKLSLGRPGVDSHVKHETEVAVLQIDFLLNEGALITATSDDSLHLWNFRQKRPEIVHSLKFQKERITYMHLPVKSKWLYVGSERGNIHIVNVESFVLSGYVINWNKAIDV
ncbi:hypothetical protein PGB90_002310 [Kerria lacca]